MTKWTWTSTTGHRGGVYDTPQEAHEAWKKAPTQQHMAGAFIRPMLSDAVYDPRKYIHFRTEAFGPGAREGAYLFSAGWGKRYTPNVLEAVEQL